MGVLPSVSDLGQRNAASPAGAPQQITKIFPFQSYFDASYETLPASAMLAAPPNAGIVQSTLQNKNQSEAYAIGLAPWSEAPIAVRMQAQDAGLSSTLILRPGEILAPNGLARGEQFRSFRGLEWGLPFGWLGGGLVTVFLFKSPDSLPQWVYGAKEVCFHKLQTTIIESSAVPPNPMFTNWPTRFPWRKAFRGSGIQRLDQTGDPNLSVKPTRTLLRLNGVTLAAAEPARLVFWGTDTFDQTAAGLDPSTQPTVTESAYYDFSWPTNTSGGFAAQQQVISLPEEISMIASQAYGVTLEAAPASPLLGATVNIARFGLI